MSAKYTPMMMQYLEIKEQNKDAIVMFRLGDFYEMFFEDATIASKILDIALTGREAGVEERVPMCGVPFHSASSYIQRLVEKGHKVAIVEQLTNPGEEKGIVQRGVVKIVTPGTVIDGDLEDSDNNFIACYQSFDLHAVVGLADVSTGETFAMLIDLSSEALVDILLSFKVKEVVVHSNESNINQNMIEEQNRIVVSYCDDDSFKESYKVLFEDINNIQIMETMVCLFNYLVNTQKRDLPYLKKVRLIENENYINMDIHTKNSLELLSTVRQKEKYGSLYWLLDHTKCAMGSRLLKQWIDKPLVNLCEIEKRLDTVELLMNSYIERESIKEILKEVYDLERLAARVSYGNINPRDLKWIGNSLKIIPELRYHVQSLNNPLMEDILVDLVDMYKITDLIDNALVDNPPLNIKDGGIIRQGFDAQLDEYLDFRNNGKQWILDFEANEKEKTGIKNLKIGYNRIFGYYIEITKANLHLVKEEYQYTRKQSLSNAERFITPELKEMENKILSAEDKISKLEYEIFHRIKDFVKHEVSDIQKVAYAIAKIDVFQSLAVVSSQSGYVRPKFNTEQKMYILDGKHAVIDGVMKRKHYVENDVLLDKDKNVLLITGPNMGGKSTYMRQIALTVIMAQIGCYVCAKEANLPIVDKIFTRIGASDDLISGQSTFMVEMIEANKALQNATKNSLIVFDEIGRGTATFDGMAIAQSIIEYIVQHIGCLTLFSTHYHELTELENTLGHIQNIHASVSEQGNEIVFLYKMKDGKANKSYGINVAKLANLPEILLDRSKEILVSLEGGNHDFGINHPVNTDSCSTVNEPSLVELYLDKIDPMEMSPMEALNSLVEIKKLIGR